MASLTKQAWKAVVLEHLRDNNGFTSTFWITNTDAIAAATQGLIDEGRIEQIENDKWGYPAVRFKITEAEQEPQSSHTKGMPSSSRVL